MKKLFLILIIGLLSSSHAMGQDETPPAPNNMQPAAAWSVFNENFRNEMYDFALPYGRWLVNYRPKTLEGYSTQYRGDRNFQRMITIYGYMADNANDPLVREAYVDSAITLYGRALEIFDEEEIDHFRWRFDRARFIQINQGRIENGREKTMQEYKKLYDENPAGLAELADGYYITYLIKEMLAQDMKDEAIALMDEAEQYVSDSIKDEFDEIRNGLFRSPEDRLAFVESQLSKDPNNMSLKVEQFELHSRLGNRDTVRELAKELYEADPNYENTMRLAEEAAGNANYNEAIRYYREALDRTDDNRKKAEVNLKIADNYLNQRNLKTARDFARRAQSAAPNWGDPIIKEAEVYAQAVTECSGTLDRQDKAVYWLVLDLLEKAQRVDSDVASTVQRQLPAYRGVIPNSEEKFYMGWNAGESFRVDASLKDCYGWIGQTTKVR